MATQASALRAYIRSSIIAATGLPEASILKSPRFQVSAEDLPIIAVYTHSDKPADADAISDRQHDRIYTVAVEVNAGGRVEEDATDEYAVAIRHALLGDGTQGGRCSYTTWASQEWGAKETQIAESATLMLFSCHYLWRPDW